MRNLKKFLALVLTVMMVMGLMVTANAVNIPTKDGATVTAGYGTAVDVLYALGVLKGDGDGIYDPKGPITRGEFATMLYRIGTGDVTNAKAADWEKYNEFTDVPNGEWYSGPVGYALKNGLMNGRDVGVFALWENISGYEALTGMLRVLGYDQNGELSGSNWNENAVYGWAVKTGVQLTDNLGVSRTDLRLDATRELIAQMTFDTIQKDPVWYNPIGGVNGDGDYEPDGSKKLGEAVFGLKLNATAADLTDLGYEDEDNPLLRGAFGRPPAESVIVANGKVVGGVRPEPVKTFDKTMTEGDLFAAIGATGIASFLEGDLKGPNYIVLDQIYVDGVLVNYASAYQFTDDLQDGDKTADGNYTLVTDFDNQKADYWDGTTANAYKGDVIVTKGGTDNLSSSGNGTIIEIYDNSANYGANHYILVAINEYLGTVTDVDEDEGIIEIDGTYEVEVTGCEEGDVVLYQKDDGEVVVDSLTVPLTISGKVTKIAKPKTNPRYWEYTVGSANVLISRTAWDGGLRLDIGGEDDDEYYLDSCGNIIGAVDPDAGPVVTPDDTVYYGYLLEYIAEKVHKDPKPAGTDALGNPTDAEAGQNAGEVFTFIDHNGVVVTKQGDCTIDPTTKNVTAFVASNLDGTDTGGTKDNKSNLDPAWQDDTTTGVLFGYKLATNGKISEIVAVGVDEVNKSGTSSEQTISVSKGNPSLVGGVTATVSGKFGTDETVYIVAKATVTGKDDVKVYVGYNNLPANVTITSTAGSAGTGTVLWILDSEETSNIGVILITVETLPSAGTTQPSEGSVKSKGYAYFADTTADIALAQEGDAENTKRYTYSNVWVDGVKTTIMVSLTDAQVTALAAGDVYAISYDEDKELYVLGAKVTLAEPGDVEITSVQSTYYLDDVGGGRVIFYNANTVIYQIKDNTMVKLTSLPKPSEDYTISVLGKDVDGTTQANPLAFLIISVDDDAE